ncbi:maltokinase N-terminal cap-like domain-containing protein [Streptomyces cavernicola]|uniref:1,4-alpha-glucan branching protein n=1 Tax=Streptomyces cavernicola TaxID=3043613 RepID=A0ABT6S6Q1_9ACTN|nr:1,4-alpha-glucan branching protein [Streptomyces sp. B-S-A6]MDI3403772.1 1,4-alpha-glucan branching protein [Streptomyces sp. B-S-A6]
MALIHQTTLKPTKLELLTDWLPSRAWYAGTGAAPELRKAGGFRLDDPEGEVGIEFMVVTDVSGAAPVTYHVPLSYRGAPLDGAEDGLVGTTEHGVLGKRWVYDAAHDPVAVGELLALLQGRAQAQAQNETDVPDRSVTAEFDGPEFGSSVGPLSIADDERGTRILAKTAGVAAAHVELRIRRVLGKQEATAGQPAPQGHITADWKLPEDGGTERDRFVEASAGPDVREL